MEYGIREEIARIIYSVCPHIENFMPGEIEPWERSRPLLEEVDQILPIKVGKLTLRGLADDRRGQ